MSLHEKYEIPEILYEEPKRGEQPSPFPFIEVKVGKKMPPVLFIEEFQHTGESEPDEKGNPQPIVDRVMHKYVDLEVLKEKLPPHLNDLVRVALGMQPLKKAQEAGQKILDKVGANAEKIREDLLKKVEEKKQQQEQEEKNK